MKDGFDAFEMGVRIVLEFLLVAYLGLKIGAFLAN